MYSDLYQFNDIPKGYFDLCSEMCGWRFNNSEIKPQASVLPLIRPCRIYPGGPDAPSRLKPVQTALPAPSRG